jgi:hypothetical protein
VSSLTARGAQHLYVDGGVTIQRFLRAGLIQRLVITRVPVLIGDGIPLFGPLEHDITMRHVATRHYPSGLVQSEYRVEKTQGGPLGDRGDPAANRSTRTARAGSRRSPHRSGCSTRSPGPVRSR